MFQVAVMGLSDAGKDTFFKFFEANVTYPVKNIKFSAPMKRMLEDVYSLESEQLEDKEFRKTIVPTHPEEITWNELMVRCYEHFPLIDPLMMVQKQERLVNYCLDNGIPVFYTDIRNDAELDVIGQTEYNIPLITIYIHRKVAICKPSDMLLERLCDTLFLEYEQQNDISFHIYNDGTKDDLKARVKYTIEKIHEHLSKLGIKFAKASITRASSTTFKNT